MLGEWVALDDWQQLPDVSGIYVIRHRQSQKAYVGQSKNVRQRIASHRYARSWHYFGRALRRHGLAAFEVCLLTTGAPEDLGRLEKEAIATLGTLAPAGYNLAAGGLGPTGVTWTYERRQAQSLARTGFQHRPDSIEKMREAAHKNNGFRGKKHTAEAKAKIGAATVRVHTGMKRSPEVRANISASLQGRAAPVLSPETREQIRLKLTGRAAPHASRPGELNPMYGVRGASHPSARRVAVWRPEAFLPQAIFDTATAAAAWAGVKVASVSDWCSGRYRPKNGCLWAYI
jgi:group I intron endonuclease